MSFSRFVVVISSIIFFVLPGGVYAIGDTPDRRRDIEPTATPVVPTAHPTLAPTRMLTPVPTSDTSPEPTAVVHPTVAPTAPLATPTPVSSAITDTPSPTPLPITPIAPLLYPQTVTTISPSPSPKSSIGQVSHSTPTPTPVPVLKTTLPRIMNLLTYGNNEEYYGQTGFTTQETHILYAVALLFFASGIMVMYPQLTSRMLRRWHVRHTAIMQQHVQHTS